jgi:hypothetical protein
MSDTRRADCDSTTTEIGRSVLAIPVGGFAVWTLCSHAIVASGRSLRDLVALFSLAAVVSAVAWLFGRRRRRPNARSLPAPLAPPPAVSAPAFDRYLAPSLGVAGCAGALGLLIHRNALTLWWSLLLVLSLAFVRFVVREAPPARATPVGGRARSLALAALATGTAVAALVLHRPDADDSFYVNIAGSAADAPDSPVLQFDTLHGIAGMPLHQPVYRIASYELLVGAIAWISGVPAIAVMHIGATALFAALLPLAWAGLFRRLTPDRWLFAAAALVAVLAASGDTHRWYGNFALPRIWQGKSIFLFVCLPLIYTRALDFAVAPSFARGVGLAAAQIAAVGASSSAVWQGPAAALMALASGITVDRRGLRTLAMGAITSVYVLVSGWWLMQGDISQHDPLLHRAQARAAGHTWEAGMHVAAALRAVFGGGLLFGASLASIASAWALCGKGLARRFAIVLPLAVWGLLLDPYLERELGRRLTGPSYWRVLWCLPVPALMALVLSAPLRLPTRFRPRLLAVLGLVGFCALVPRYSVFSAENRPREVHGTLDIGWPRLKVPRNGSPSDYEWAARLCEVAGPEGVVVAPEYVSLWVPTFSRPARPLIVREAYLRKFVDRLGRSEVRPRRVMTRLVEGEAIQPDALDVFSEGLARFRVRAVLLAVSELAPELRSILALQRFRLLSSGNGHELWSRLPEQTDPID